MQAGSFLQHAQGKIACAATEVENRVLRLEMPPARLRDQFQHQRRVDGCLLAGLEIAETFDVLVEPGADFVSGGFVGEEGRMNRC